MSEFFDMGGYGGYIWPAYTVSLVGVAGLALLIWRRSRRLKRRLAELEARDEAEDR